MNELVLQDASGYQGDITEYALQELECASGGDEPCPPVTATATFSLFGIDYGKVEDEELTFRRFEQDERMEKAFEWLRNTKRIFVEQGGSRSPRCTSVHTSEHGRVGGSGE